VLIKEGNQLEIVLGN